MSSYRNELGIPFITTEEMREVDRAMEEGYHIKLIQMMENAGLSLARVARRQFLDGDPRDRQVIVLAGTGGNGGGGLVCARRLHNWGASVQVWLTSEGSQLAEVPRHQLSILERMEIAVETAGEELALPPAELLIDALIGYSLRGAPTGTIATLIHAANGHGAPILSLDVPSGVDATTGTVYTPAVRASATMTLAMPKRGILAESAKDMIGELYLGDIGVPPELYSGPRLGLSVGPIFAKDDILRIW